MYATDPLLGFPWPHSLREICRSIHGMLLTLIRVWK